jgi:Uma2 family endonuclease
MSTEMMTAPTKTQPQDPFHIGWRPVQIVNPQGKSETEYIPLTLEDFIHPQQEDKFMVNLEHADILTATQHAIEYNCRDNPSIRIVREVRIDWQVPGIKPHGPDIVVFEDSGLPITDMTGTIFVKDSGLKPLVVIETTSPSTRTADYEQKYLEFLAVGIPYYVIVDAAGPDDADVKILGYRRTKRGYQRLRHDDSLGIFVPGIDLYIQLTDDEILFADPEGRPIPSMLELADHATFAERKALEANQRAESEKQRADALALEVQELKAKFLKASQES